MGIDKKDLSILYLCVAVPDIRPSFPEGFHLCSQKRNPSFISIINEVIMPSLLVLADQFFRHNFILAKNEGEINH